MSQSELRASLEARVGEVIYQSDWLVIDQARIDAFAEATGDQNYNYGILSKHFAAQSLEYGPYNDYLVSYYD